jgi:hypothetical protein
MYRRAPGIYPQSTRQSWSAATTRWPSSNRSWRHPTDEDKAYLGYSDAIALTGMVAEHLASLPPPPPLMPHAPLLAAYKGQEVPRSPGVSRRRRDQLHGVVINPPPKHQPEVIVDLVSDNNE